MREECELVLQVMCAAITVEWSVDSLLLQRNRSSSLSLSYPSILSPLTEAIKSLAFVRDPNNVEWECVFSRLERLSITPSRSLGSILGFSECDRLQQKNNRALFSFVFEGASVIMQPSSSSSRYPTSKTAASFPAAIELVSFSSQNPLRRSNNSRYYVVLHGGRGQSVPYILIAIKQTMMFSLWRVTPSAQLKQRRESFCLLKLH